MRLQHSLTHAADYLAGISIGNGTQNAAIYCAIGSGSSSDVDFEAIRLFERPFLAGVAVMGESGLYGTCRVAAGIVGTADLMLGKGVEAVLREHQKVARNFRGIRYMGGKAETIDFHSPKSIEALQVLERMGLTYDCGGPELVPKSVRWADLESSGAEDEERTGHTQRQGVLGPAPELRTPRAGALPARPEDDADPQTGSALPADHASRKHSSASSFRAPPAGRLMALGLQQPPDHTDNVLRLREMSKEASYV